MVWAVVLAFCALASRSVSASCSVSTSAAELIEERGYSLQGQTHVITGGDSGIGEGMAEALLLAGAHVILLAHDVTKTEALAKKMSASAGSAKISVVPINLMSLASVKHAADAVLRVSDRIDAVICDAGLDHPIRPPVTADGFESTTELTYIGHFYLVELLLPQLRVSKGRVVHTSSGGVDLESMCVKSCQPMGCEAIDKVDALARAANQQMTATCTGNVFFGLYLKTMHARVLSHREAKHGVTAYSFHPGMVQTPGVGNFVKATGGEDAIVAMCRAFPWYGCLCRNADGSTAPHCPITSDQGAVSGAYLAAAPTAELAGVNGKITVACGVHPKGAVLDMHAFAPDFPGNGSSFVYWDPYEEMVAKNGLDAANTYLEQLYELSTSWVSQFEATQAAERATGAKVIWSSDISVTMILVASALAAAITLAFARRSPGLDSSKELLLARETETEA